MNVLHTALVTLALMATLSGATLADSLVPEGNNGGASTATSLSGSDINVITKANNAKISATDGGTVDVGVVDIASGAQINGSKITVITDIKNTEVYADGDSRVSVGTVRLK